MTPNSPAPIISLLMPTRGRPNWVGRFFDSLIKNTSYIEQVEVILYVDEDDAGSHHLDSDLLRVVRIIGPRMSMGAYNTACFEKSQGNIIILVNDDMVIRTAGWDEKVAAMDRFFFDGIYLAYGNDLFKGGKLCTFPILSRRTCEILREPYHRAYRGAFIDYHLMDIFKRLQHAGYNRIFYLDDVVFEHLHYRTGKAPIDATYTSRGRFDDDMLFIGLAGVRAASLPLLLNAIRGSGDSEKTLPPFGPIEKPSNLWQAIRMFTRVFLSDATLPLNWRFFMWWWFGARYVASRIL